jgi:hypothetical protein
MSFEIDIDRRTQPDRRLAPTSAWRALWPFGRRMKLRREAEHQHSYFVDRFSLTTFILVLLLLGATITDAVLTIWLIHAGAQEINPIMQHCLGRGVHVFLMVKYGLTAGGLPLLLVFQNHSLFGTRLRVRHLIPLILVLYAVLISYQIMLIHTYKVM